MISHKGGFNGTSFKTGFFVLTCIMIGLMMLLFNPIAAKILLSRDHTLSSNLHMALLCFFTSFLIFELYLVLNIILLKKGATKLPSITINIVLCIYSVLIVLVFGEVIIRLFFSYKVPKQLYAYNEFFDMFWLKPNLSVRLRTAEYDVIFRTNGIGLRDDNELCEKTADERRIVIIGDSFVQAAQVDVSNTMCYLVEEMLNTIDTCRKYEVLNIGTSGCSPSYERLFLEKNLNKFDADLLLLFIYIGNDITTEYSVSRTRSSQTREMINSFLRNARRFSYLLKILYAVKTDFPMGRPCQPFDGQPPEQSANLFYKRYNEMILKAYDRFFFELLRICAICDRSGVKLIVFLVPTKEQVDESALKEVLAFFKLEEQNLDMQRPQKTIRHFLTQNEIDFVDLLNVLSAVSKDHNTYFKIDSHWNIYGNHVVAERVSNAVGEYFLSE